MSRFFNTKTDKNSALVLDLEAVTAYHTVYEDQRRMVMVYQGPAAFTLNMSFEDFNKIFQAPEVVHCRTCGRISANEPIDTDKALVVLQRAIERERTK